MNCTSARTEKQLLSIFYGLHPHLVQSLAPLQEQGGHALAGEGAKGGGGQAGGHGSAEMR